MKFERDIIGFTKNLMKSRGSLGKEESSQLIRLARFLEVPPKEYAKIQNELKTLKLPQIDSVDKLRFYSKRASQRYKKPDFEEEFSKFISSNPDIFVSGSSKKLVPEDSDQQLSSKESKCLPFREINPEKLVKEMKSAAKFESSGVYFYTPLADVVAQYSCSYNPVYKFVPNSPSLIVPHIVNTSLILGDKVIEYVQYEIKLIDENAVEAYADFDFTFDKEQDTLFVNDFSVKNKDQVYFVDNEDVSVFQAVESGQERVISNLWKAKVILSKVEVGSILRISTTRIVDIGKTGCIYSTTRYADRRNIIKRSIRFVSVEPLYF